MPGPEIIARSMGIKIVKKRGTFEKSPGSRIK